ncbi:ABC transporter substrate-binding protein [Nocardioidaceae bacterium SCSIO 66511]|nr:ABC transporter substrate-binding protein [Nocardioidaceae bacterium SCSIO 66511]
MAHHIRRRTVLIGGAALFLSACGRENDDAPASAGSGGQFPATAEHKYGTITVESRPERIVIVGLTEQDTVLALGHTPIATTEWYGEQPYAVWPWAQDALGDAEPTVLSATDGFDFEKIATLRPDLIIGTNSGVTKDDYDKLSELAPTLAAPQGASDYFSPWPVQTRLIGDALGLRPEADKLIDDIKSRFRSEASKHPEFADKSIVFLQNAVYDSTYIAYPDGLGTEFLTALGFTVPGYLDQYRREGAQAYIPAEKIDIIDGADVLLWATEKPADLDRFEGEATFMNLAPVEEGRSAYTDGTLAGAIYFTSPLSLPYILDRLPAMLADAVRGGVPREITS